MNRVIYQLREQLINHNISHSKNVNLSIDDCEKLTELVILDCIEQISRIGSVNSDEDERGDIAWTTQACINIIKERYGVTNGRTS